MIEKLYMLARRCLQRLYVSAYAVLSRRKLTIRVWEIRETESECQVSYDTALKLPSLEWRGCILRFVPERNFAYIVAEAILLAEETREVDHLPPLPTFVKIRVGGKMETVALIVEREKKCQKT